MFIGSDVLEVTYNNPVVGNGSLFCKGGEASNIDLGGLRSTDDAKMITGNGIRINQQTQQASVFELPPVAWDKTDKDELSKLILLAGSQSGTTWTVSFVDGSIYQMQNGYPVGDLVGDGYAGTIAVKLQGNAGAKKIS